MKIDGGLRSLFRSKIKDAQWTSIESPMTAGGIPDSEVCFSNGSSCWVEFKKSQGWVVHVRPLQIAWHEQRSRLGGRSFIAVRRTAKLEDELYIFAGEDARVLSQKGLTTRPLLMWRGGPSQWSWPMIEGILKE